MSEVSRPARAAIGRAAALAWASLAIGLATMSMGCLITDPPQFKPPKHTRPFLLDATSDPDPRNVIVIDGPMGNPTRAFVDFHADVVSQDDTPPGTFQQVVTWLYLDYGYNGFDGLTPYAQVIPGTVLPAGGALEQTGRRVGATLRLLPLDISQGCHTATLVVSHVFDEAQCPVCDDDWSSITWQILRCGGGVPCDSLPLTMSQSCESLTNSCAQVRAKKEAMDAGVAACPDDSATDGGSP